MAAGVVSLRYFILGLLAQKPMSGYDIQHVMKSLSWLIGSPSAGSLYPILGALPDQGLATVQIIPGLDKPPKKIYTITEAGRRELQAWIDRPTGAKAPMKAFVMRLLLAGSFSNTGLRDHLRQRQVQVAAQRDTLRQAVDRSGPEAEAGQSLAMDYGLALANAELEWLDRTLDALPMQPSPQEDVQKMTAA